MAGHHQQQGIMGISLALFLRVIIWHSCQLSYSISPGSLVHQWPRRRTWSEQEITRRTSDSHSSSAEAAHARGADRTGLSSRLGAPTPQQHLYGRPARKQITRLLYIMHMYRILPKLPIYTSILVTIQNTSYTHSLFQVPCSWCAGGALSPLTPLGPSCQSCSQ